MRAAFCILSVCMLFLLGGARAATDTADDLPADAVQCIGAPIGNLRSVITFAIPQGQVTAGIIDPVLGLKPVQGCEIFGQAVIAQEQGTVVVKLLIFADGTVADIQVTAPSRFPWLNDTAIRLARSHLKFSPATSNGMPIDVERLIDVTFSVQVDERWYANPSLRNPATSEQLAFGLDRLRWGMTPDEVKAFLPTLGPVPPRIGYLAANQSRLFVENYEYAGCRFDLMLWFAAGDHLTNLDFSSSDACALAPDMKNGIEMELLARYGAGALPRWRGFVTSGSYGTYRSGSTTSINVEFQAVNAPHIMVF